MDEILRRRSLMTAGASPADNGCFQLVRHEQFTEASDRLDIYTGGSTLYFYQTYIEPYLSDGNCILAAVSNNSASGNNARYMIILPVLLPMGTNTIYLMRGSNTNASKLSVNATYDFFLSQGSIIDVWVYNATYPIV